MDSAQPLGDEAEFGQFHQGNLPVREPGRECALVVLAHPAYVFGNRVAESRLNRAYHGKRDPGPKYFGIATIRLSCGITAVPLRDQHIPVANCLALCGYVDLSSLRVFRPRFR